MRALIIGILLSLSLALLNWLTLVLIINPGRNTKPDSKEPDRLVIDKYEWYGLGTKIIEAFFTWQLFTFINNTT